MLRIFKESLDRKMQSLDGEWYYCADKEANGKEKGWEKALPAEKLPIIVPSCFSNELGMLMYEGSVWMETDFAVEKSNIRLVFGAVNNECDVYLDGELLGSHYGGFTEFAFYAEGLAPGFHHLCVRVSNEHNEENTIPLSNVDWYHYGGIIRSVEIHEYDKAIVERVKLEYVLNEELTTANLCAKITLHSACEVTAPVSLMLDGNVLAEENLTVNGDGEICLRAEIENVSLWSPEAPNLYTFAIGFAGDSLRERTGFRSIEIKDRQFFLNGKSFIFKGVNRHEEHPDWGFAVPLKIAKKDIDIIRDMGCNMIRGSHYPNAKTTLDYMDETGMMFWEEIPMWGFPETALANELVRARGVQMHTEMVTRDYNHPCIITWGLNNEVDTNTEAAREVAKLFRETLRSYDQSRPITYATHRPLVDICYEYADFISVNNYIGWYGGPLEGWPAFLDQLSAYLEETGNGDKPLVMSEFGAGGIYGSTDLEDTITWTENYQQEYLEYTLDLFLNHPRMNGTIIWQYCDIRAGVRTNKFGVSRALSRPRSFNNKGLVNEFRRPKMAYYAVKKIYREK